jgi:hypothetical protein
MTFLLAAMIGTHVYDVTKRATAGIVASVAFASSTFVFGWVSLAETYSLTGLLLFSAFVLLSRPKASRLPLRGAGAMLGLSAAARSYLTLLIPLFCWW